MSAGPVVSPVAGDGVGEAAAGEEAGAASGALAFVSDTAGDEADPAFCEDPLVAALAVSPPEGVEEAAAELLAEGLLPLLAFDVVEELR